MSTLADSDEHDAPPRRAAEPVPQAEVSTQSASQTPDADTSVPDGPADAFTQQRIGALVLQRLFDRKPTAMRIGRFSVLERIGRGGMGTVYSAYDEQLDRKVAVKVLGRSDRGGDVARRRLQREAQAMARLSHPNVVTVHEVGESDGEVFVAMEFIRGQSLDAWIKTSPDWREVVEVFVQAGRGLIAAHEAGLVHRDLKPHNIMRTDEGVVKVLDFGLARAAGDDSVDSLELPAVSSSSSGSVLDDELTRTGAVLGTPAYMSPEQHRGRPADARSDQFSFCVALYEALYGRRPFEAPTLPALVQAVLSGELQSPPPDGRVPTWVHRLVVRGLSLEPERRWPSMQVLVQQLERDPSRARRRLWAGAGGATLVGLLGFGLAELRGGTAEPSCPSAAAEAESLWSEARQQRVVDAFVASNSPLADDTLTRVAPMLEAYAGALGQMREEACLSHRQGVHSDRLFDLRTACLDQRRAGLDELLAGLEHADAATVGNAAWAAASLPPIDRCADTEALTSAVPPPDDPAVARQVQAEREALASASSLVLAGSYDEARARMDAALRTAESLGHAPLVAEAQLGRGTALMESREHEPALEALSRALVVALRSGHDEVAVEALARRMWVLADPLRRPLEALGDDEIAEALLDKLERPTRLQWLLLNNRGVAQFRAGRRGAAEGSYREALRALGPEGERRHPVEHISTRFNLAMLLSTGLGEPAAAARELRSARDQAIELLGPDHPRVAFISIRLAAELVAAMQLAAASEELEAGLVRWTADEPLLRASLLLERANLRVETRRYAEAVRDVDEALALADVQALGSVALSMRANARIGLGEVEAGLAELREAIAVEVERAGPEHETVANAHLWAAYGLRRAGRLDEAVAELERAEAIFAGLGLDGPSYLGRWLPELVSVEIAREQLDRADAALARIVAAQDEAGFAPDNLYRLQLAKLHADLLAARGDRRAAAAAYESACAGLEAKVGPDYAELAACTLGHARALGPTAEGQALARRAQQAYRALGEGHAAELADAMAPWATEGEEIDAG